jgi:hypothetical protein
MARIRYTRPAFSTGRKALYEQGRAELILFAPPEHAQTELTGSGKGGVPAL